MNRLSVILPDVLKHEGGWSNRKEDPGGATMQGVTLATYRRFYGKDRTKQDLRNITRAQLEHIYETGYWLPVCAHQMWAGMDRVAFDAAVNSGPSRSLKWIQKAVGATPDGRWGPQTKNAIWDVPDRVEAVQRACAVRMSFLRSLRHWGTFGKGWSRRVAHVEAVAAKEAGMGENRRNWEVKRAKDAQKGQTAGGAGALAGSGGLFGVDLPWEAMAAVMAFLALAAVFMVMKALRNRDRAKAYEELEFGRETARGRSG